jgi:hypothetical protein
MTSARKHKRRQVFSPTFLLRVPGKLFSFLKSMPVERRNSLVAMAMRKYLGAAK